VNNLTSNKEQQDLKTFFYEMN
jgi:calcium-dependent protein kinase